MDVHAAKRRRVQTVAKRLRPDVAHQVRGGIGVAVHMAIKAGDATVGACGAAILRLVELLLRKRRDQQPQSLELLGIQDAVEQLIVIHDRHNLALRDVAQIRTRRQVDRRRKLRQEVLGQIVIEVEPREVARFLSFDLVDVLLREEHPALGMIRMRQREQALGPQVLLADLLRRQLSELRPSHGRRESNAHTFLDRLAARHGDTFGRPVAQVVALLEQVHLALHDSRLGRLHARFGSLEVLLYGDGRIAGWLRLLLLRIGHCAQQHCCAQRRRAN